MDTKNVVESYTHYDEENRLTTDNARKVEYITSIKAMERFIKKGQKVLDCAAGTGIYAFHLADMGCQVTALDITPRHVDYINGHKGRRPIESFVNDARDLSCFDNESFDIVLCMGPLYHLTAYGDRHQCFSECKRVLKPDGILVSAYINRFFVIPNMIGLDKKYLDIEMISKLKDTGQMSHDDEFCFWTDSYYGTPEEMEDMYQTAGLTITDHLATDGHSIFMRETVNAMNDNEFQIWCDYHYATCREKSILGISNHGLIIGRK